MLQDFNKVLLVLTITATGGVLAVMGLTGGSIIRRLTERGYRDENGTLVGMPKMNVDLRLQEFLAVVNLST